MSAKLTELSPASEPPVEENGIPLVTLVLDTPTSGSTELLRHGDGNATRDPGTAIDLTDVKIAIQGTVVSTSEAATILPRVLLVSADQIRTSQSARKGPAVWYHEPIVQAQEMIRHIDELSRQHKRSPYAIEAPPAGVPKCNLFLYDVMDKAGVPLPHGKRGERLIAAELDKVLSNDPNFEKVWERNPDEKTWRHERLRFESSFHPRDGDIAIWNNRHLEHTCLLEETIDGTGNTYYAGSDTPAVRHTPLIQWWVDSKVIGYGAPDAIYRYKYLLC